MRICAQKLQRLRSAFRPRTELSAFDFLVAALLLLPSFLIWRLLDLGVALIYALCIVHAYPIGRATEKAPLWALSPLGVIAGLCMYFQAPQCADVALTYAIGWILGTATGIAASRQPSYRIARRGRSTTED